MKAASKGGEFGKARHGILAFVAAAALAACGGGGGGGGGGAIPPPDGGSRPVASGLSSGLFLGRGSVIVNGVQFTQSAGAPVFIDNVLQPTGELALEIGMIAKVRGTFGPTTLTGTYSRIDVDPQLIGTVANPTAGGFSVLNQAVTVTPFTIFDGIPRIPIAGTVVEVHGSFTGASAIEATFVRAGSPAKVQVRGEVTAVDPATATFSIGTQAVSHATLPLPQAPAVGEFVEVEGNPVLVGGAVQATAVVIEDLAAEAAGLEVEAEGSVAAAPVGSTFTLRSASGPITVSFGATTLFENEDNALISSATVLAQGNQVEVEGNVVGGILQATEIELERKENVVLEGNVTGGTLFGLALSPALSQPNGTHVEVGGSVVQGSAPPFTISVIRVTPITDPLRAGNLLLQGPVANVNVLDNTFSILGIPIDLTGVQERDDPVLGLTSEFENAANIRIDRGTFMDRLRSDSVVKAKAVDDPLDPPFAGGIFRPRAGVEIEEHR